MAAIALISWLVRVDSRSRANDSRTKDAMRQANSAHEEIASFREKVATEYVTTGMFNMMKNEIMVGINRLSDKLDRWIEHSYEKEGRSPLDR